MKEKRFCQCKDGDLIYIFDYNFPENGVRPYKVIDVKHVNEEANYCGCGPSYVPEHWFIHFDSPYLDRSISVEKTVKDYVSYSGSHAVNDNGKAKYRYVNLGLFTELTHFKETIIKFYKDKIAELNSKIASVDKEIDKLNSFRSQYSLTIADINDRLLVAEQMYEKV